MKRSFEDIEAALSGGPLRAPSKDPSSVVLFETLWSDPADGWSIASRANARAMLEAGIDVRLHSWAPIMSSGLDPDVERETSRFQKPCPPPWGLYIYSCTLARAEFMRNAFSLLLSSPKPRTFYTTFERHVISPVLGQMINALDGVWVPCKQNLQVLEAAGVKNATWIPFPYFDDDPHLALRPEKHEAKNFYWIGRWEPRKAPDNLVRAFIRAFRPGEAKLTLKTSPIEWHGKWPSLDDVMMRELRDPMVALNGWTPMNWKDHIHVMSGRLPKEDIVRLHAENDVYVSASRGEGTDLPALAAKLSGNRLLTTDSGGPRDFLGENDILVPSSGTYLADPIYGWEDDAVYADYKLDHLIAAFQQARSEPTTAARDWPMHEFHGKAVGEMFKQWIEKCKT